MKQMINSERFLILAFVGIIFSVPLSQGVLEIRRGERPLVFELFRQTPTAAHLRGYEHDLEDASQVAKYLRPWALYAQFTWFKDGGEKALLGRNGWLFYGPGVQYLTERPEARKNTATAKDAIAAIVSFRDQLASQGIELLVVPAPNKESIYPEMLTCRARLPHGVMAEDTRTVLNGLKAAGVEVVDLFDLFANSKDGPAGSAPLYLAQDSHWSPAGMHLAAQAVARRIFEQGRLQPGSREYEGVSVSLARLGDIVRMLQVPALERQIVPESISCEQIVRRDNRQKYEDDPDSEVLVLGDSFLRIYETDEPGSAGFIAHLAKELKRPLTSIVNDGGASTLVRQELSRRPALLKNKKLVIWEFVERDIRLGTEGWQILPPPAKAGGKL
jgi:hypothetical protein